jgi:hypothetical protein
LFAVNPATKRCCQRSRLLSFSFAGSSFVSIGDIVIVGVSRILGTWALAYCFRLNKAVKASRKDVMQVAAALT